MKEDNIHHIFRKDEVKNAIIRIYGIPTTDEERQFINSEVRWAWKRLPKLIMDKESHKLIHLDDKKQIKCKSDPYKRIDKLIKEKETHEEIIRRIHSNLKAVNTVLQKISWILWKRPLKLRKKLDAESIWKKIKEFDKESGYLKKLK